MENNKYNSLTEQLIQNGILSSPNENKDKNKDFIESFYGIEPAQDMSNSPFVEIPIEEDKNEIELKNKKRINIFDSSFSNDEFKNNENVSALKFLKRFFDLKTKKAQNASAFSFENILYKFFPRLYKVKIAKEAMRKLSELNIDTKALLDKTIPYGESEGRYEDLIKYLNYANEIQTRLRKKI